jgi:hypothetical protein
MIGENAMTTISEDLRCSLLHDDHIYFLKTGFIRDGMRWHRVHCEKCDIHRWATPEEESLAVKLEKAIDAGLDLDKHTE